MPLAFPDINIPAAAKPGNTGLIVPYKEIDYREGGSPVETFDWETGGRASRVFKVAATDVAPLGGKPGAIAQILGYPTYKNGGGGKFQRWLPECHPAYPWLVANKVAIKGLGSFVNAKPSETNRKDYTENTATGGKMNFYNEYRLAVDYEVPDYSIKADDDIVSEVDRYVSMEYKPNGDYLSLPTLAMKWAQGADQGQMVPGQLGAIISTIDVVMTWHQVPFEGLPITAIQNSIGKVNKTNFPSHWTGPASPHTLLLTAVDINRLRSPFGTWAWKVKYTMKWNKNFHTNFLHVKNGTKNFYQISIDGVTYTRGSVADNKLVFDEIEFLDLFRGP